MNQGGAGGLGEAALCDPTIEPGLDGPVDASLTSRLSEELSEDIFRFCSDPTYRLWQDDHDALCNLPEGAIGSYCQALTQACKRAPWEDELNASSSNWDFSWLKDLFGSWGSGSSVFGQMTLVLGALLLVIVVGRAVRLHLRRSVLLAQNTKTDAVGPAPAATNETPERLSPSELMERANLSLAEGQIKVALHFAYRAAIRTLSSHGLVSAHPGKTTGQYLKDLRQSAPEDDEPSELLKALDHARFRTGSAAEQGHALTGRVEALLKRLGHVSAVLISLATLSCDAPAIPQSPSAPGAPRGHLLLERLLASKAELVQRRVKRITPIDPATSLIIALQPNLHPLEWQNLRAFVEEGGHLVLAGAYQEFDDAFGIATERLACKSPVSLPGLTPVFAKAPDGVKSGEALSPLANCGDLLFSGRFYRGEGAVTLVGDETFFENRSLVVEDNAQLAFHLFYDATGAVELIGPWTGRGAMHPLESIFRGGFDVWVFQLLLLVGAYAWYAGRRSTTPVKPPRIVHRSFSEHARALAHHYRRQGQTGWALRRYAEWVERELFRRTSSGQETAESLSTQQGQASSRRALKKALITARRADELGQDAASHLASYEVLKEASEAIHHRRGALRTPRQG